ncbi:MAG: type III pantothenate kinase [Clostridia bacterium]|nr:type III pantothenate kinase [Clostridia bacterium]
MLLTIDVGNTNITLGVYDGDTLLFVSRMATKPPRMEDQYAAELLAILKLYGVEAAQIDGAVLSSVVPRLTDYLAKAIRRVWNVDPFIVSTASVPEVTVKPGVSNELGADLVVGAAAAKALYPCPSIVIDMGTATTLTGINSKGEVCGVIIIPGLGTSLDALTNGAAQLSSVSLQAPPNVLGTNTMECIQSGMIYGTACMLDGLCDRIEEEMGETCTVVATGGLAGMVVAHCRRKIIFSDMLLLDGLKIIWENHK